MILSFIGIGFFSLLLILGAIQVLNNEDKHPLPVKYGLEPLDSVGPAANLKIEEYKLFERYLPKAEHKGFFENLVAQNYQETDTLLVKFCREFKEDKMNDRCLYSSLMAVYYLKHRRDTLKFLLSYKLYDTYCTSSCISYLYDTLNLKYNLCKESAASFANLDKHDKAVYDSESAHIVKLDTYFGKAARVIRIRSNLGKESVTSDFAEAVDSDTTSERVPEIDSPSYTQSKLPDLDYEKSLDGLSFLRYEGEFGSLLNLTAKTDGQDKVFKIQKGDELNRETFALLIGRYIIDSTFPNMSITSGNIVIGKMKYLENTVNVEIRLTIADFFVSDLNHLENEQSVKEELIKRIKVVIAELEEVNDYERANLKREEIKKLEKIIKAGEKSYKTLHKERLLNIFEEAAFHENLETNSFDIKPSRSGIHGENLEVSLSYDYLLTKKDRSYRPRSIEKILGVLFESLDYYSGMNGRRLKEFQSTMAVTVKIPSEGK